LLTHAEITTSAPANCLPQDDTQIVYPSSTSATTTFENNEMDSITFNNDLFEVEADDEIIIDTANCIPGVVFLQDYAVVCKSFPIVRGRHPGQSADR
jgi:hypothetical protein